MRCPVCGAEATAARCGGCNRPLLPPLQDGPALRLEDIEHTYGTGAAAVHALRGTSFAAARGEITVISGPSGGGKSTALLTMGLLLRPTSGTVSVAGEPLHEASEKRRARVRLLRMGFVFQQFNLLAALTAEENVLVPLRYAGVAAEAARDRARDLLRRLGLERRAVHRPADLSGGEKQRVAVARALALGPDIVLADEPTANLDSRAGRQVTEQLAELARAQRSAVVVVTHDTRLAPLADRVLHLEDGRLNPAPAGREEDR
ncbi:ABC transporter ATP-binding protein [Streptomyces sodiiphilus]